jgi:toxin ParE1/3/4
MSAPEPRLILTRRAQRDLRALQLYTLRQWRVEQALAYEAAIDRALGMLRDHPQIGRERPELRPGLLSLPIEHHILYYRIKNDVIEVVGILYEREDAFRRFRARG